MTVENENPGTAESAGVERVGCVDGHDLWRAAGWVWPVHIR